MNNAVIFDMDGVLIGSHPVHKKAWVRFLSSVGRTVTDEELDFVLDGRKREDILAHFLGKLTPQEVTEYGHRKEQFFRQEAREVDTIAGVRPFLADLQRHKIPMAVASSGSADRVRFMLESLSLKQYFSAVITGDDVRNGKPDPAIFLIAAESLGVDCESSLVVEDAVAGVVAAKAARMKCMAIANNGRAEILRKAGADRVVTDFTTLSASDVTAMFCSASAAGS